MQSLTWRSLCVLLFLSLLVSSSLTAGPLEELKAKVAAGKLSIVDALLSCAPEDRYALADAIRAAAPQQQVAMRAACNVLTHRPTDDRAKSF